MIVIQKALQPNPAAQGVIACFAQSAEWERRRSGRFNSLLETFKVGSAFSIRNSSRSPAPKPAALASASSSKSFRQRSPGPPNPCCRLGPLERPTPGMTDGQLKQPRPNLFPQHQRPEPSQCRIFSLFLLALANKNKWPLMGSHKSASRTNSYNPSVETLPRFGSYRKGHF